MNRFLYTDRGSAQKRIADVWLMFTAGTAGAIPTDLTYADFIDSVVLDSTGVITVHLQDPYVDVIEIDGTITQATPSVSTASRVIPAITTDVSSGTDPKVVVNLLASDDGLVANMGTGDIFRLHFALVH